MDVQSSPLPLLQIYTIPYAPTKRLIKYIYIINRIQKKDMNWERGRVQEGREGEGEITI